MEDIQQRYASDRLGFYIASSDQDILSQVGKLMTRSGYVGVMDTAGRLQYLIDGRRGSPYAARRIVEATGRVVRDRQEQTNPLVGHLGPAVDLVLAAHTIRPELKGYRYLRYMLLLVGLDEAKLRPISKTLYPAAAAHFRVSTGQVERDVRYSLQGTDFQQAGLTGAAAICRLYDEMMRVAENLNEKQTSSAAPESGEGCY